MDLNPIRADICQSLEKSEYTSVKQRIDQIKTKTCTTHPIKLSQFIAGSQTKEGIAFTLTDYLELSDWTGRSVRADKRDSIYYPNCLDNFFKNLIPLLSRSF